MKEKRNSRKQESNLMESVIDYLLSSDAISDANTISVNSATFYESSIASLGEAALIHQLYLLEDYGYISINSKRGSEEEGYFSFNVTRLEPLLEYHNNTLRMTREKRNRLISVIISIFTLIASFISLALGLGLIEPMQR